MSAPQDPHGPEGTDELELGADYEAFLADAQRALEPTASDAARVRAGLDAALSARGVVPTEPTSQGVGGAGQAGVAASGCSAASITVRWVGLAVLALAVLGGVTLSLRQSPAGDASGAAPATDVDGAVLGEPTSGGYEGTPGPVERGASSAGGPERAHADSSAAASDEPGVRGAHDEDAADAEGTVGAADSAGANRAAPPTDASGAARVRSRPAPTPSGAGAGQDSTESGNPPAADEGTSAERGSGAAETTDTASGAAMPAEPSLLAREAARLLRARNALSAGRPSEALELTTRLPEGDPLGPERRAIRVRALCALGRTAEARQVAGTLGQGNGPSAAAVRASCVGEP